MKPPNLTAPRQAVLDVVRASKDHPTAADIMELLAQSGKRFAYATIYNSLKYLTDQGMIRELALGNGVTRYDGRLEDHQHVVCVRCGAIAEAGVEPPKAFMSKLEAETGYHIQRMEVHLTGLCPACRAKSEQS
ncbi:MAG: transcriptional repressor [Alicyclobacillus sp.]|nr:transcriptional repressor [Alicyclobacillus sp.]